MLKRHADGSEVIPKAEVAQGSEVVPGVAVHTKKRKKGRDKAQDEEW